MSVTFTLDPRMTPELLAGIGALWADVSNAGGAVGFVPPVTADDIRPEIVKLLAAVADGRARLLVGRGADGSPVATALLTYNAARIMRHWLWVHTVMVRPSLQGQGHGRALMAAVAGEARAMDGVESLRLTCRGGLGLEDFYARCGYREVGRVPRAIRVADDDYRDDVTLWLPLRQT
ncbi:GNAT family N-acetyltransferase [Streptomyces meridianus]|uniref:GNAT family N-acetyltransferase n=1 Tax=Streptomyces meridianus TaxID=2938945 RepID=A0ABT0X720_9ACTN|nr:GNAT family N-acetyltransferase [Streptomyces meridianus]MCM2578320.1 GNAT family N-acetyltransferase [Streptomyces meridianus]